MDVEREVRLGMQAVADRLTSGTCRADCGYCAVTRARKLATAAAVLLLAASVLAGVALLPLGRSAGTVLAAVALPLAAVGWCLGARSGMGAGETVRMVLRWPAAVLVPVALLLAALSVANLLLVVAG